MWHSDVLEEALGVGTLTLHSPTPRDVQGNDRMSLTRKADTAAQPPSPIPAILHTHWCSRDGIRNVLYRDQEHALNRTSVLDNTLVTSKRTSNIFTNMDL